MTDITKAETVYVSTSDNADYVEATQHDGAVKFIRADLVDPAAIREAALREAEKTLRDWRDNLILCGYREAPVIVGMAADVVIALENMERRYMARKAEEERNARQD